jgi:hypothetical protein
MKIRPVGAELFHADGQTDRHDEANSRSSQFGKALINSLTATNSFACVKDTTFLQIYCVYKKSRVIQRSKLEM